MTKRQRSILFWARKGRIRPLGSRQLRPRTWSVWSNDTNKTVAEQRRRSPIIPFLQPKRFTSGHFPAATASQSHTGLRRRIRHSRRHGCWACARHVVPLMTSSTRSGCCFRKYEATLIPPHVVQLLNDPSLLYVVQHVIAGHTEYGPVLRSLRVLVLSGGQVSRR